MNNKIIYAVIGIVGVVLVVGLVFIKGNNTSQPAPVTSTTKDAGVPSDPQDIVPGTYPNKIKNISTITGLNIKSVLVENNLDLNSKPTNDHLEITLKNSSNKDMNHFEIFYSVLDLTNNKKESYYKTLAGLVLKSGEEKTIHLGGKSLENNFGVNKDGIYFTSKNKLQFDIQVSTPEFKIATFQATKDAGGAELKD
jgi:hypothetical protein